MMRKTAPEQLTKSITRLFLVALVAISVCLAGCGGQSNAAGAGEEEPDASAADGGVASEAVFSFDLSGYESLETNSVVIILADGSTEMYTPESAGRNYGNDGVSEAFFAVNRAFDDNPAKANARYEGATVIIKAPITIIDDTQYVILSPNSGSWFGFGCKRSSDAAGEDVTFPMVFVRNSESTILELDLDKGDEVLIAAPLSIVQDGNMEQSRMFILGDGYVIEAV